jgi:putative DNA primase/helicase
MPACDQRDVIAALEGRGWWDGKIHRSLRCASRRKLAIRERHPQQANRCAAALAIWPSTIPANGTRVETYLAARGLTLPLPLRKGQKGIRNES